MHTESLHSHPTHSEPAVVHDTAILIQRILASDYSVEKIFIQYFRAHPHVGKRDREAVVDHVMYAFRHFRFFTDPYPQTLHKIHKNPRFKLSKTPESSLTNWLMTISPTLPPIQTHAQDIPSAPHNLPNWLWLKMLALLPDTNDAESRYRYAHAMAASYCQRAPLDIRVNHWRSSLQQVAQTLSQSGYRVENIDATSSGLWLSPLSSDRSHGAMAPSSAVSFPSLYHHPLWKEGRIEIQDRASQWVVKSLSALPFNPTKRRIWVDYCAGSGGKTLAMIARLIKNTATAKNRSKATEKPLMIACDDNAQRLQQLKVRVTKARVSAVQIETLLLSKQVQRDRAKNASSHQPIASSRLTAMLPPEQRYTGRADVVLVDAPCSGLGTLRRSPEIAWRLTPVQLQEYALQQLDILQAASMWVRPGGFLLYATCSWSTCENREVIQNFMRMQPHFSPYPLSFATDSVLWKKAKSNDALLTDFETKVLKSSVLSVNPLTHQSDGFFMALMQRIQ